MTTIKSIDVIDGWIPRKNDSYIQSLSAGSSLTFDDLYELPYRDEARGLVKSTLDAIRYCEPTKRCWHPACPKCGGTNGRLHRAVYQMLLIETGLMQPHRCQSALDAKITYRGILKDASMGSDTAGRLLRGSAVILSDSLGRFNTSTITVVVNPPSPGSHDIVVRCLLLQQEDAIEEADSELESLVRDSIKGVIFPRGIEAEISLRQLDLHRESPLDKLAEIAAPAGFYAIWSEIFKGVSNVVESLLSYNFYAVGTQVIHGYGKVLSVNDILVPVGVTLPADAAH